MAKPAMRRLSSTQGHFTTQRLRHGWGMLVLAAYGVSAVMVPDS